MKRGDAGFGVPAELIGHPARSAMLLALLDGRALPMSMLASEAGVAPSTASEHLAKLTEGGLLRVRPEGRRRYFELASTQVADALEVLSRLASPEPVKSLREGQGAYSLRLARTCYDHLAGSLGVAMMGSLITRRALLGGDGLHHARPGGRDRLAGQGRGDVDYQLSDSGRRLLDSFGVRLPDSKRPLVRYCVDWTEQRHHLAGALGAALLRHFRELDWVRPHRRTARALVIADVGRAGFGTVFGIDTTTLPLGTQA
jgi:DNA-binding transcriptional ArsR family regulator